MVISRSRPDARPEGSATTSNNEVFLPSATTSNSLITSTETRVRYAETDQMGVAHHTVFLVWCELGRTQHMREQGVTYRDLENEGIRLPVVEANLRFRAPARYDDVIRIDSWVRDCASRRVQFGNAIFCNDRLLATAQITLIATSHEQVPVSIPTDVRKRLEPTADPVRM